MVPQIKKPWFLSRLFQTDVITKREIIALILPLVANQMICSLFGIVSTAMLNSNCPELVVSEGLFSSTMAILTNLFQTICIGGSVIMAQYIGKGERENVKRSLGQTYTLSVSVSLLVALAIFIFGKPYLSMLYPQIEKEQLDITFGMMCAIALSLPVLASFETTMAALRALGNGKATLFITTTSNGIYLFCNWLLVVKMGLGVVGIGIAYAALRIYTFAFSVYVLKKYYPEIQFSFRDLFVFDKGFFKKLVNISLPIEVEQFFLNLGPVVSSIIIAKCGTDAIRANAIVLSLANVSDGLVVSIDSCTTPIVGRCVGAGKPKDARKLTYALMLAAVGAGAVLCGIYLPIYPLILENYSPNAATRAMVPIVLISYVIGRQTLGIPHAIGCSALKASGDSAYTSVVSLVGMWGVSITLSYTLAIYLGMGLFGTYLATFAFWLFRACFFVARINGKKWCKKKLV